MALYNMKVKLNNWSEDAAGQYRAKEGPITVPLPASTMKDEYRDTYAQLEPAKRCEQQEDMESYKLFAHNSQQDKPYTEWQNRESYTAATYAYQDPQIIKAGDLSSENYIDYAHKVNAPKRKPGKPKDYSWSQWATTYKTNVCDVADPSKGETAATRKGFVMGAFTRSKNANFNALGLRD